MAEYSKDEVQWTCPDEELDTLKEKLSLYVSKAGKHFNMEIPMESDAMYGASWLDTH